MTDVRSGAAQAGVCDEQQLLFDASAAFTKADAPSDLDAAWRNYVVPVWDSIDGQTQDLLSDLYKHSLSNLAWDNP